MKYTATLLALAGAVVASPSVNPTSASLALYSALPSSLQAIALTNPAAAATIISSEFASSATPSWFSKLPADVQTYFITAASSAVPTTAPLGTGIGGKNGTALSTGKFTNSTTSSAAATSSGSTLLVSSVASATGTTTAKASSSSGGAAMPTQAMGAGLAGVVGLIGMLAL